MIQNLIFDLDGTIVNSYPLFVDSFIAACEKNGIDVPYDRDTVFRMLKITVPDAYRKMDVEHKTTYEKFYDDYVSTYSEHYTEQPGFAQTIDLIKKAQAAGKKNFIYTHTGPIAKEILKNIGILDCFEFVLDASYPFPMKPAPDALLFLAEHCGLDPKSCLMIGDRPIDALAGMNAGMLGFLWDEDGLYPDAKVDYRCKDITEVAKIVGI
ncbi:MAG: HAD-IA family hydrolase [Clostridia bacterium]|nr:HAD-IA family hydrolase [Clostridia bacterium]